MSENPLDLAYADGYRDAMEKCRAEMEDLKQQARRWQKQAKAHREWFTTVRFMAVTFAAVLFGALVRWVFNV